MIFRFSFYSWALLLYFSTLSHNVDAIWRADFLLNGNVASGGTFYNAALQQVSLRISLDATNDVFFPVPWSNMSNLNSRFISDVKDAGFLVSAVIPSQNRQSVEFSLTFIDFNDAVTGGGTYAINLYNGSFKLNSGEKSPNLFAEVSFGFPMSLGLVDIRGNNAVGHWVHPLASTRVKLSGRFDCAVLSDFNFTSFVTSTPLGSLVAAKLSSCVMILPARLPGKSNRGSVAYFLINQVLSAYENSHDPDNQMLMPGRYTLNVRTESIPNGIVGQGMSQKWFSRNLPVSDVELTVGFPAEFNAYNGIHKIGAAFDANLLQAATNPAHTPTFATGLSLIVYYASMRDYSVEEIIREANASYALNWPVGLDPPVLEPENSFPWLKTYFLRNRTVVSGVFDIGLKDGVLFDVNGIGNAAAMVRVEFDAQVLLKTSDGLKLLPAWPSLPQKLYTNSNSVRFLIKGVNGDPNIALNDVIGEMVDKNGKSVRYLLLGGLGEQGGLGAPMIMPVAVTSSSIEWLINLARLVDGRYIVIFNETGPLVDLAAGTKIQKPQTFELIIKKTLPKISAAYAGRNIISIGQAYIGSTTEIQLPSNLFDTADLSELAVVGIETIDSHNLSIARASSFENVFGVSLPPPDAVAMIKESVLRPGPHGVRGPAGNMLFTLVVIDPAKNILKIKMSLQIMLSNAPKLRIIDNRDVVAPSSEDPDSMQVLYTGGGNSSSCIYGALNSSVTCSMMLRIELFISGQIDQLSSYSILTLTPQRSPPPWTDPLWLSSNWSPVGWIESPWEATALYKQMKFEDDFSLIIWTFNAENLRTLTSFTVSVPEGSLTIKGKPVPASNSVDVVFDIVPPGSLPNPITGVPTPSADLSEVYKITSERAVPYAPFSHNLTCSLDGSCALDLFWDDVTPQDEIIFSRIKCGLHAAQVIKDFSLENCRIVGLKSVGDKRQGKAQLGGVLVQLPSTEENNISSLLDSNYATFEIEAEDAAGNSVKRIAWLYISPFTKGVVVTVRADIPFTSFEFSEGSQPPFVFPTIKGTPILNPSTMVYKDVWVPAFSRVSSRPLNKRDDLPWIVSDLSAAWISLSNIDSFGDERIVAHDDPPEGSIEVRFRDFESGTTTLGVVGTDLDAAQVSRWIASLKYHNNLTFFSRLPRVVSFRVLDSFNGTVAFASRTITLKRFNNAPVITGEHAVTYIELSTLDPTKKKENAILNTVKVLPDVVITDEDDIEFEYAVVSIGNGTCDKTRDRLFLDPYYTDFPAVTSSWSLTGCALTLSPAFASSNSAARTSFKDLTRALQAVYYTSSDVFCPTTPDNPIRLLSLFVQDHGSEQSDDSKRSSVSSWLLNFTLVDDPPLFLPAIAYGKGGFLSSKDPYANIRDHLILGTVWHQRPFVVLRPTVPDDPSSSSPVESVTDIEIYLGIATWHNGDENPPGVFGLGGGIRDLDSVHPPTFGLVSLRVMRDDGSIVDDLDIQSFNRSGVSALSYHYAEGRNATLTLSIRVLSTMPDSSLGPVKLALVINSTLDASSSSYSSAMIAPFFVDLRASGCTIRGSINYTFTEESRSSYYPANSLCSVPPVRLSYLNRTRGALESGSFASLLSDLREKARVFDTIQGSALSSISERAELLIVERNSAVGAFQLSWGPERVTERVSLDISVKYADSKFVSTLPEAPLSLSKRRGEIVPSLVLSLSPAGAIFSSPIRICLIVGDQPVGRTFLLLTNSLVDPSAPWKGWKEWKITPGGSYNVITGELCGNITSFSCVAPFSIVMPTSEDSSSSSKRPLLVNKFGDGVSSSESLGGGGPGLKASCPLVCSGHGFCQEFGKCTCFAGFSGLACNRRSCPVAPSWSADTRGMSIFHGPATAHTPTECSGQGHCDHNTGLCKCNAGFEGSACERLKCQKDCSGRGKCRLISELSNVRSQYDDWEAKRITRCVCDYGFSGSDCSERLCPFGDDPNTIGDEDKKAQVWQLDIDFSLAPPIGEYSTSVIGDLAFVLGTSWGEKFTTRRAANIWEGSAVSAKRIDNAFRTIPAHVLQGVSVSPGVGGTNSHREFLITFSGSATDVNMESVSCYSPASDQKEKQSVLGCPNPGCSPKVRQLALISGFPSKGVTANWSASLLREPSPIDIGDDKLPNVFSVSQTVTVRRRLLITHDAKRGIQNTEVLTFSVSSLVFGKSSSIYKPSNTVTSPFIPETPLPPRASRLGIHLLFGLKVDFSQDDTQLVSPLNANQKLTTATYSFNWRLPSCSVKLLQQADPQFESVECGRRGLCDRSIGMCECFRGYVGASCSHREESDEDDEEDNSNVDPSDGTDNGDNEPPVDQHDEGHKHAGEDRRKGEHGSDVVIEKLPPITSFEDLLERRRYKRRGTFLGPVSQTIDSNGDFVLKDNIESGEFIDPSETLEKLKAVKDKKREKEGQLS